MQGIKGPNLNNITTLYEVRKLSDCMDLECLFVRQGGGMGWGGCGWGGGCLGIRGGRGGLAHSQCLFIYHIG